MTIRPARSRSRSWRATSSDASTLVLSAVSSMWCSRVERPELTSIATSASVWLMHDVAAGAQLHGRREHRVELALDAVAREDRLRVLVELHVLRMARHEHAHEFLGVLVAVLAGDDDLVDVLGVEVADRALGERAFLVDQRRRGRFQRQVADLLPDPQQVFEVALDLGLGAGGAGGAQDDAHALRNLELLGDLAKLLAVVGAGDLAADAAAARGVGHQHAIAAGEREIGRERRALGAALLLDHLHQHDLPALDDLLDLVLAAIARRAIGHLFHARRSRRRIRRPLPLRRSRGRWLWPLPSTRRAAARRRPRQRMVFAGMRSASRGVLGRSCSDACASCSDVLRVRPACRSRPATGGFSVSPTGASSAWASFWCAISDADCSRPRRRLIAGRRHRLRSPVTFSPAGISAASCAISSAASGSL